MTTAEELHARKDGDPPGVVGATIVTVTGRYFDFEHPTPEMVSLTDIAYGLARTCRFGGQFRSDVPFYSVAQHSVYVACLLGREDDALFGQGLFHDAAEAYVGDMVGPLKRLLPMFKEIEGRAEFAIAQRFGLSFPWDPRVKRADLQMLRTEQRDMTAGHAHAWTGLDEYQPLALPLHGMMPAEALSLWLGEARRWCQRNNVDWLDT